MKMQTLRTDITSFGNRRAAIARVAAIASGEQELGYVLRVDADGLANQGRSRRSPGHGGTMAEQELHELDHTRADRGLEWRLGVLGPVQHVGADVRRTVRGGTALDQ